jgi:hypothetical protein
VSKLTILGITAAVLLGILHGFCEGMFRLVVDEDPGLTDKVADPR